MDTIIVGLCAISSSLFLVNDYYKRQQLNNLMISKEFENFEIFEGVVKSETSLPIENAESTSPEIIGKETTTSTKNYHTYYKNQPIYSDGETTISVPVAKTYELWNQNNKTRKFAKNIQMKTNTSTIKHDLYFSRDAVISWDETNNTIVNNIKTTKKILFNDQPRTIFGKQTKRVDPNDQLQSNSRLSENCSGTTQYRSTTVKYIGDEIFVNEKIRSDHFGINNWKTSFVGICFSLSAGYLINVYKKDNRQ